MGNSVFSVLDDGSLPMNLRMLGAWILHGSYVLPSIALLCLILPPLIIYLASLRSRRMLSSVTSWHNWPVVGDLLHMHLDQAVLLQFLYIRRFPVAFYDQLLEATKPAMADGLGMVQLVVGTVHIVGVFGPDTVGEVLSSTELIDKSADYDVLHKWLGTGLLTSAGRKWQTRRKMLTPSFHFNILKDFLVIMNQHALSLKEKLATFADTGESVDIFPFITLNSLDIICATAMGVEIEALHNAESEYVKAVYLVKEALAHRQRKPWLWNDFFYYKIHPTGRAVQQGIDYMHSFADKVIKDRHAVFNETTLLESNKKKAFLDMLLGCIDENGQHLSFEDIREEVDTFMFEGHDTTAAATSFTLHLLGENPDELRKCQQELDAIFESPRETTLDDLRKMTYLEAAIKEALRLFPSVPWYARALHKDTEFAGHTLPKGVTLLVFTTALHMDPKTYPEPHKFDPTRFLAENTLNRHPYAYVPFSAGARNCIGQKFAMMELKTIVSTVIRNLDLASTQRREDLKPIPGLILQPKHGIQVKITSR